MNLLLELSLRGSAMFLLILLLDKFLASRMSARARRWWWAVLPLGFLVIIRLPVLHAIPAMISQSAGIPALMAEPLTHAAAFQSGSVAAGAILMIWLSGVVVCLLVILVQTRAAMLRWTRERLSTDSALLSLLEDCRQEASITAPIGLVVSSHISTPAILGWLRPRILLPESLASSMPRSELRAVLFHELAHFRSFDMAFNWLFTLVRVIHWFNPLAHLAFAAWVRFREEAADEAAMTWMKDSSGTYGEALLHALRQSGGNATPFGALAIGESIHNLKRRITMIRHYQTRPPRFILAGFILIVLVLGFVARPVRADETDPRAAAVAAMQTWLTEIDRNQYAQSWQDASPSFQHAINSDGWVAALTSVRTPLGACASRKLASALHQTEVPGPAGVTKGDFVVAQFNTSFQNLAYAVETVCFEKAPDGVWRASGYYIKPRH